jgi:hypothetical protein
MILKAIPTVAKILAGSPCRQIKGDDPDEKGYIGPTGCRLSVVLTTPFPKTSQMLRNLKER